MDTSATVEPVKPGSPTVSRVRWVMVGFAFFATIFMYLDRQVLAVVNASPAFQKAVPHTVEEYGYALSAFMLAYTISNGLSGPFIDAVGTRIGYACCMVWWSISAFVHVLLRGPWTLAGFRFLIGAGEAGNWPAAAKLVSEWFPAKERALGMGIFNSGASVGNVISTPIIAALTLWLGWRSGFILMGVLGVLWLVGWWFFSPTSKGVKSEARPPRVPALKLLRTRFVLSFTLSKIFMDPVWYFIVFWFPTFLHDVHHFNLKEIGWRAWIPYFTAFLGNLAGGFLTSWLMRSGVAAATARKASAAVFALAMTCTIPAILVHNAWLAIALVAVTTFGYTGYTTNTLAFPADVFPKGAVASVWGLASMGSGFGGMLFMALSGWGVDHFGYTPVFIGYGIMPVLALLCILFLIGPLRQHPAFQQFETAQGA